MLPAVADARAFGSRTLERGSTGSDVRTLQELLTRVGYATTADGVFGRATARSVKAWEAGADRRTDGRVTPRDARALRSDASRSEEHTSELQSRQYLVCRLLLEKKQYP